MYESLYYILWQFGLTNCLDIVELSEPGKDKNLLTNSLLCEPEIQCLERIKEHLQKNSNMTEIEAIGFMTYRNIPERVKNYPVLWSLPPEEIMKMIDNYHTSTIKVRPSK